MPAPLLTIELNNDDVPGFTAARVFANGQLIGVCKVMLRNGSALLGDLDNITIDQAQRHFAGLDRVDRRWD